MQARTVTATSRSIPKSTTSYEDMIRIFSHMHYSAMIALSLWGIRVSSYQQHDGPVFRVILVPFGCPPPDPDSRAIAALWMAEFVSEADRFIITEGGVDRTIYRGIKAPCALAQARVRSGLAVESLTAEATDHYHHEIFHSEDLEDQACGLGLCHGFDGTDHRECGIHMSSGHGSPKPMLAYETGAAIGRLARWLSL